MRLVQVLDVPAHVELAFEGGVPVAVNGIAMSAPELLDSLATIAADHGFVPLHSVRAVSDSLADLVTLPAREALAASGTPGTGTVRIKLHQGEHTIVSVSPSALDAHA